LDNGTSVNEVASLQAPPSEEASFVDKLTPIQKRIVGCVLSVVSGFFYGVNFDPPQYIMDHSKDKNGLDYVFSHFCGIYLMSTVILIIYAAYRKNQPVVYSKAVLPGFLSGVLWAIAQTCFFIANANLEMVVSFPLVSTVPGIVANIWGIFVFKEIKGARNFLVLGLAFAVVITAVVIIALSKVEKL